MMNEECGQARRIIEGGMVARDDLVAEVAAALKARGAAVVCAYLFGSVARGQANRLSDVDIAVLFHESLGPETRLEITAAVVAQVQRVSGPDVDLLILNEAAPAVAFRALRDGRLMLVNDERERVRFETRAIREYLDFQPVLERYDQALLRRAREGRLGA